MGCATKQPTLEAVESVNLEKFMGDWYVLGYTPTFIDDDAYNAVESYKLNDDGTIAVTYTFNKGAADGPEKTYTPKGFVKEGTGNAVWGMQFIWPIKADYRIIYLDDDYSRTIIGRNKRDYVWIMAREPSLPDEAYQKLEKIALEAGYDQDQIKKMPQISNK